MESEISQDRIKMRLNLALVLTGGSGVASMIDFGPVSTVNRWG